jgi:hypothetical protein
MDDQQPEALRLADALDAVPENGADPDLIQESAAELRRLYWDEHRVREHRDTLAAEITKLHEEVAKLQAENTRLREWHATAWNRGHAVGLNGLNTALRQMEEHRKSDAWGNTQLTEALLLAEEQRDELLAALKLALPTLQKLKFEADCSYGSNFSRAQAETNRRNYEAACAAIAKAEGEQHGTR